MKRLLVALTSLLILGVGTAQALPGLDPQDGHDSFEIFISASSDPNADLTGPGADRTTFVEASGWDFGDRTAYSCAYVEFFRSGSRLFELNYKAVSDYGGALQINDKFGQQTGDDDAKATCWAGDDAQTFVHDGSDHFPHGTSFVFNDVATGAEIARIDYPNQCAKLYWTPGMQAGEAWLWWDEDGPEDKLEHGDGLCGGGPAEPIAVVRAKVRYLTVGIEACTTDAMDGNMCFVGTESAPSVYASDVTLRLRGGIKATGVVRVAGDTAGCRQGRVVVIERRASSGWKKVGRDRTSKTGRYADHIRPRDGVYRARLQDRTLATGDICQGATSRRRSFGV
jgi:hypothetical protein